MKVSHCENCGDDIGQDVEKWPGEFVTCGKPQCDRVAREEYQAQREEAHEQLDRDMGWR